MKIVRDMGLSEPLKSSYESYYENADSEWRRLSAVDKADNIVLLCKDMPHDLILEIGAGDGAVLKRLAELNFAKNLFALEISSSGIEAIQKKSIPQLRECKTFDGYDVPYENDKFDIAILSHVLEHVEHPRQLLYEASRVARLVFVEVPTEDTTRLPEDFVFNQVGHINFYSPRTIRLLLQSCGLKVLAQIVTNPQKATYVYQMGSKGLFHYYIKQLLIQFLPGFSKSIFVYHTALIGQKTSVTSF